MYKFYNQSYTGILTSGTLPTEAYTEAVTPVIAQGYELLSRPVTWLSESLLILDQAFRGHP